MPFSWDNFPYTNFHELNLDWFIKKFKEIFDEWESLYTTLTQWKDDTDADLAQWKDDTLSAMTSWENDLIVTLNAWKRETGEDIDEWEAGIISDLNDWKDDFNTAFDSMYNRVDAIVSDTEDMVENLAKPFSTLTDYYIGDYVIYNGVLYQFTSNHSAGAWNSDEVSQRTAMNDIGEIKNNLINFNSFDMLPEFGSFADRTTNGITYTWNHDKSECDVNGSATNFANCVFYSNTSALPSEIVPGKKYQIKFKSTVTNVGFSVLTYYSDNTYDTILRATTSGDYYITIPTNAVGIIIRFDVRPTDPTVNHGKVSVSWLNAPSNSYIEYVLNNTALQMRGTVSTGNLDDFTEPGIYMIGYPNTITGYNLAMAAWLIVMKSPGVNNFFCNQTIIPYYTASSSAVVYNQKIINRNYNGTVWTDFNTLPQNTLSTTGGTQDRTSEILAILTRSGYCELGPGVFYVNGLDMPDRSIIKGSGNETRLILSGTSDGYAIKMGKLCTLKDFQLMGATSEPIINSIGGRNGILWKGNYTQEQSSANSPQRGVIDNVFIRYFTGGAITCDDTGIATYCNIMASNCFIDACGVGLYIKYYSEYHKFTNIRTSNCLYGCINNGGNNMFLNCDFSTCKTGLLMDNSLNQSPNNSHGSMVGCVFNHINNNTGNAIEILNCDNGFVFDGCQIFFGKIEIDGSEGITVSNCNFGTTNTDITIDGGGAILFVNNMHGTAPTITVTNNANVHFANCYVRSTGAAVTN